MKNLVYLVASMLVMGRVEAKQINLYNDSTLNGVKFVKGLTWKEVLKKAKKEHKYIFIDCFTTWCGPCKLMENEIFPKKEVGDFYNRNFLSVRCQMDKTDKDEDAVKIWYKDAERIKTEYGMPAFPTYLYFSPEGKLVYRDVGYKDVNDMISIAKNAVNPNGAGRFLKYYSLLAKYQLGKKDYKVIPALIDTARYLRQNDVLQDLVKDYEAYIETLPQDQLYKKEYISIIASLTQSSKDKFFHLFYPNGEKVDSVMAQKGFAHLLVDQIILNEDIYPYLNLEEQNHKDDVSMLVTENSPDWPTYKKKIAAKYDSDFANRTVLQAQVSWYEGQHDYALCAKYFTILINNYSQDNYNRDLDLGLNTVVWNAIFKRSVDKEQIDLAVECMQGIVERQKARGLYAGLYLDTYANLLYKAGRVKEAVEKEEEAIQQAIKRKQSETLINEFRETLDKIKTGKPTWPRYIDKNDFFGNGLM
ncbi:thioredoxin family protein [Niastella vici]|nr:thioredoxin fold domain-containing protein [Niastella vici]